MHSKHTKHKENYSEVYHNQTDQTSNKEKILNTAREKGHIICRCTKVKVIADFS